MIVGNVCRIVLDQIGVGRIDRWYTGDSTSLARNRRSIRSVPDRKDGRARNNIDSVSSVKKDFCFQMYFYNTLKIIIIILI